MSNGKAKLFATELSGQGGYEPGPVFRQNVINLSIEQFSQIERGINNHGFWQLTEPTQNNAVVLDGAEWIIEGATDKYHVARNWQPESEGVYEIGQMFLKLSGWTFPDDEIY